MNVLDRALQLGLGISHITAWLGMGGEVVDKQTSQERADICNGDNPTGRRCEMNREGTIVTGKVADAVRLTLEAKNKLELRVSGERMLGRCEACGCVLRLLVHEPQARIKEQITDEERKLLPDWCWKLKP